MLCPKCGYALSAFDKECPRCTLQTSSPQPVASPAPPPTTAPPATPTSVRPPTLPNQAYGGQGPVRPAPPASSNSNNIVKIVLIVVVCSILGIAVLTIGVLSFLGNKMRSEMQAVNVATAMATPAAPGEAISGSQPPAGSAAQAVPADYLKAEREYHETFMQWTRDYDAARDELNAQPVTNSTALIFANKVNEIWKACSTNPNTPTRFTKANTLLAQGLSKVHDGMEAANREDSKALGMFKEGENIMAQGILDFDKTCDAIRSEANPKGVLFFN